MPGCALRAANATFEAVDFLKRYPLPNALHRGNSLNVVVSDADGDDLAGQVKDALAFLQAHRSAVQALCAATGGATLDFGLWRKDTLSQSLQFPPQLVVAAADLGLSLGISIYAAAP
jgi:hypothetical protein